MATQTSAKQLYDILVSKNLSPQLLTAEGMPAQDPSETDVFSFDWVAKSGQDYGTVVIMFDDDHNMTVYFGDNIGKSMEGDDKQEWFDFLYQMRMLSKRNLQTFSIQNLNKLKHSMKTMSTAVKEGLFESWTGTKTHSWNAKPTEARLMIKHKKIIGEGDARYRYVESLFIETVEGERFKLPFTKISAGKAMLEHVRQGGKPYDARGNHITQIVNEMNVLSRFYKANRNVVTEDEAEQQLIQEVAQYHANLKSQLGKIATKRGYTSYFESWNPEATTEQDLIIEGIRTLFATESSEHRMERALPALTKIKNQGTIMKETGIFEGWINCLAEGTWELPDTPEKQQRLIKLLSKELPVGPDATNATEQLYDLLGDDELFDRLEELADQDANADARTIIINRLEQLASNPAVAQVIGKLKIEQKPTEAPQEPVQEEREETEECYEEENIEEEIERISELSRDTLKSYIKKASSSGDVNSASNLSALAAHKLASGDDEDDGYDEDHKSYLRSKGIARAVDRLEEDSEGYKVVYTDKNGKYVNSSKTFDTKDKAQAHADHGNSIDRVGGKYTVNRVQLDELSNDAVNRYKDKAWDEFAQGNDKRGAGLGRAIAKQRGEHGHVKPTEKQLGKLSNLDEGRLDPVTAREILDRCECGDKNFFELNPGQVGELLKAAKEVGYRKSKYAPGSTARMFHQYLTRLAAKAGQEQLDELSPELLKRYTDKATAQIVDKSVDDATANKRFAGLSKAIPKKNKDSDKMWGVKYVEEGAMKDMLWDLVERMDRERFIEYTTTEMGMDAEEAAEFWDSIRGDIKVNENFEDSDSSPVESAILNRIIHGHPELLQKYGPAAVMDAARGEAEFVGDVDEIGSSDVSGWVKNVVWELEHARKPVSEAKSVADYKALISKMPTAEVKSLLTVMVGHNRDNPWDKGIITLLKKELDDREHDSVWDLQHSSKQINELSPKTLGSYAKKSLGNPERHQGTMRAIDKLASKTDVDMTKWMNEYDKREENFYTENILAVAKLVGTPEDIKIAKEILERHHTRGYLSGADSKLAKEIHSRLWPLVKQKEAEWNQQVNEDFDDLTDMTKWMNAYDEREDRNDHTSNIVAVAELVGTPEDVKLAKGIQYRQEKRGHLSEPDSNLRNELNKRLWPRVLRKEADWNQRVNDSIRPGSELNEDQMNSLYSEWIDSDHAPSNAEYGNDSAVMKKAINYIRGRVPSSQENSIAREFTKKYYLGVKEGLIGKVAGTLAGSALGGPVGATLGGLAGDALQDKLTNEVDMGQADRTLRSNPKDTGSDMSLTYAMSKAAKEMGYDSWTDVPDSEDAKLKSLTKAIRGLEESTALTGQYGHPGKMQPVKSEQFGDQFAEELARLRALSLIK